MTNLNNKIYFFLNFKDKYLLIVASGLSRSRYLTAISPLVNHRPWREWREAFTTDRNKIGRIPTSPHDHDAIRFDVHFDVAATNSLSLKFHPLHCCSM